jgi:hypothetical protein
VCVCVCVCVWSREGFPDDKNSWEPDAHINAADAQTRARTERQQHAALIKSRMCEKYGVQRVMRCKQWCWVATRCTPVKSYCVKTLGEEQALNNAIESAAAEEGAIEPEPEAAGGTSGAEAKVCVCVCVCVSLSD